MKSQVLIQNHKSTKTGDNGTRIQMDNETTERAERERESDNDETEQTVRERQEDFEPGVPFSLGMAPFGASCSLLPTCELAPSQCSALAAWAACSLDLGV